MTAHRCRRNCQKTEEGTNRLKKPHENKDETPEKSIQFCLLGGLEKVNMKRILILGAGRSSAALLKYFLNYSGSENIFLEVADQNTDRMQRRLSRNRVI